MPNQNIYYNNRTGCFTICNKHKKLEDTVGGPIFGDTISEQPDTIDFGADDWENNNKDNFCVSNSKTLYIGEKFRILNNCTTLSSYTDTKKKPYLTNGVTFSNLTSPTGFLSNYYFMKIFCSGTINTDSIVVTTFYFQGWALSFIGGEIGILNCKHTIEAIILENKYNKDAYGNIGKLICKADKMWDVTWNNYGELIITSNNIVSGEVQNYGNIITFKSSSTNINIGNGGSGDNLIIYNNSDILTININSIMKGEFAFINKSNNANVTINIGQDLIPTDLNDLKITFSESSLTSHTWNTTVNNIKIKDFTQDTKINGINVRYCVYPTPAVPVNPCTTPSTTTVK